MSSSGRDFTLDQFQLDAIDHLDAGRSVLVAAPTGAGKTIVAEHAIDRALSERRRAFYTAPIKALSNQKFRDLTERVGAARVGLLTGDNAINADADIVVMTTEVLRNMLYEGRDLDDLAFVVMDEVHYLEDTFRGPVWEEVILHLPEHVKLVCLSATVSNTDELAGWLTSIRGETGCVVERKRPVELTNLYAVADRRGQRLHVVPTLVDGDPNSEGHRFDPDLRRGRGNDLRKREKTPFATPSKLEVLDHLEDHDLLPVIWFVFSRRGCDEAAIQLERAGARFTDTTEADRIRAIADERLAGLPAADLAVLDTSAWLNRLERGIASHHAGLVPAFKETVEQCFAEGLVRVVFATETLALGVNLPARSVVIDKLTKFTGETHEQLTPAQFTQLTGRAGRRGLDATGHAIVPWSPFVRFEQVAGLAGSKSYRLRSAFRPTYNMAVNLLQRLDADAARALLARSFAQYQADAGVARLEQRLARERDRLRDLEATVAELPPLDEPRTDDHDAISDAVSRLRPGDLVVDDDGLRSAVLGVSWRKGGRARVRLVNESSREVRWNLEQLEFAP
ncbi:MAG: DEAD/DEAH box helicase, partial [Actinomycetota bacterium]